MEDVPTATVMEVTTMAGEMNGIIMEVIMEEMMIGKAADQTIILPVIKPQLK